MSNTAAVLPGFTAETDNVLFTPELEAPREAPYGFAYFITIRNDSDRPLTIRHRKWVVFCTGSQSTQVMEGDGVVGQTPRLLPGEDFTYNSRHFVAHDSIAVGSYFAVDDEGTLFGCQLEAMKLHIPPWAMEQG